MIANKNHDSNEFRHALAARNIRACVPPKRYLKSPHAFDRQLYKSRHMIENMSGKLKDWQRIAIRYDRCAQSFFAAICIAASFIFYFNQ
jgi:transposase